MSLKSALARSKLFANPDQLAIFLHLNPTQLSGDEAFHLLRLVGDAQLKDTVSPLKFSVAVKTINALARGNRIGNLINTPVSPTKTTGSCGKGKAMAALSLLMVILSPMIELPVRSLELPWTREKVLMTIVPRSLSRTEAMIRNRQLVSQVRVIII